MTEQYVIYRSDEMYHRDGNTFISDLSQAKLYIAEDIAIAIIIRIRNIVAEFNKLHPEDARTYTFTVMTLDQAKRKEIQYIRKLKLKKLNK